MDFFPAFLKLDGRAVLLVGAGAVAARKARLLSKAGARLTVVAPEAVSEIVAMAAAGRTTSGGITWHRREFEPGDVDGHWLAVSATGIAEVEQAVAEAAEAARVFCNAVDDLDSCSYITPAIVDRSPIVVAVSSAGNAPVLARRIRARLEAELPARLGELAALAGRWRERVSVAIGDFRRRLRFWESVFDGDVAHSVYAGRVDNAEWQLAAALDNAAGKTVARGEALLVGAGPGDPGLLTLAALQALQDADVIMHDRLVSQQILDRARRDAEFISVGKKPGCRANQQEDINTLLVQLVGEGKRVCRIKGGDPFIFGRGGEEADALADAGLPYRVIPGITAAAGCAAAAGIPLTHRDHAQSVVLVTGHGRDSVDKLDWPSLARDRQTLAVYMGVRRFPEIMQRLTGNGRSPDTPIAIIERGTTPEQRVIGGTLGQLTLLAEAHRIQSPSILIIGEVAGLVRTPADAGRNDDVAAIGVNSAIPEAVSLV